MEYLIAPLRALSPDQIHALYQLRTAVFVVEQACAYQEVDDADLQSEHLLSYDPKSKVLSACARIVPPGVVYPQGSIGRVAVRTQDRGKGWGRAVFAKAMAHYQQQYPGAPLKIQAQEYLEDFYASFGFRTISDPYPDVGIMHVDMIWQVGA